MFSRKLQQQQNTHLLIAAYGHRWKPSLLRVFRYSGSPLVSLYHSQGVERDMYFAYLTPTCHAPWAVLGFIFAIEM